LGNVLGSNNATGSCGLCGHRLIPQEKRKTLKTKTAVRIGKPYQQITEFAREAQTDLLTMGVRGRGALDIAVFGSTTYRVMQLGPALFLPPTSEPLGIDLL
jgi:hypothetical protein